MNMTNQSDIWINSTLEGEMAPVPNVQDYIQIAYYSVFVVIGIPLNLQVLYRASRRYSITRGRVFLLQFHLNISDLMILIFHAIFKISWYSTYEWQGGTLVCKFMKFLEMIAFVISSNVIVCIGFDRLSSLKSVGTADQRLRKVKISLLLAWTAAILCSVPMLFAWSVATKDYCDHTEYHQCITVLPEPYRKIWSVIGVLVPFWIPATLITACYGTIGRKVYDKLFRDGKDFEVIELQGENRRRVGLNPPRRSGCYSEGTGSIVSELNSTGQSSANCVRIISNTAMACFSHKHRSKRTAQRRSSPAFSNNLNSRLIDRHRHLGKKCSTNSLGAISQRSTNQIRLRRRRYRTLRKTFFLVCAYIFCWLPYNILELWSLMDDNSYRMHQDTVYFLYGMITLNSVVNPLIYGDIMAGRPTLKMCGKH